MYISRRKPKKDDLSMSGHENLNVSEKNETVSTPDLTNMVEPVMSENAREAEPLELERELYLEPEEEMSSDELRGEMQEEENADGESDENDIEVPDDPQDLDTDEMSERVSTYEQFLAENTGEGVLRVQASAGAQSIPLSNVNIVVYRDFSDGRHIFYTVTTNADGVADGMVLPAPPRINSVEGNGKSPFASYVVTAEREGLRGQTIENVPIFAGVKSIQPVNLAPQPKEV